MKKKEKVKANSLKTPKNVILKQLSEPRPLPMGRAEFDEWSDRLISGALVKTEDKRSQRFALASMIMHLGPTEDHKPDNFFIHSLRKAACNQVAHAMIMEIKGEQKAEMEAAAKAVAEQTALANAES